MGVRTLIKNKKTGIHAMRHGAVRAGQADIDGMGVATKIVICFKQRDGGFTLQRMRCCQPRNTGAHNGNTRQRAGDHVLDHQREKDKNVAKRPDANKGGREEENRLGISTGRKRRSRLRNNETVFLSALCAVADGANKCLSRYNCRQFPVFTDPAW